MNDKLITYENLGRFYNDLVGNDITELDIKIGNLIKDTSTTNNSTWSSSKIISEIRAHSGETYYAGDNININSENVISAIFNLATTADIVALFAEPGSGPADNEIWYTTESGEIWEPYDMYGEGDTLQIADNQLLSNTYENGHGVLRYANNITSLNDGWGKTDYDHTGDLRSITFPHSVNYIGNILNGNSGLTTAYYNGTVAECREIETTNFAMYADFDINHQIICTDGTYELWG